MEKRVLLGVQNKKNPIKKNKKRFLKKVVDYMKSDSYMFAPLISTSHADFLASKTSSSSTTAVETKEGKKERNKRLLEKVGDYLKSDTYMYAPLCDQPVISLKGGFRGLMLHSAALSTALFEAKAYPNSLFVISYIE